MEAELKLIRQAIKFANLAAGEGISIDGIEPEDFLMDYSIATGDEDWVTLADRISDALAKELAEVERLTKGSICEVAASNASIMEYMRHLEDRATAAEAAAEQLAAALHNVWTGGLRDVIRMSVIEALSAHTQRGRKMTHQYTGAV